MPPTPQHPNPQQPWYMTPPSTTQTTLPPPIPPKPLQYQQNPPQQPSPLLPPSPTYQTIPTLLPPDQQPTHVLDAKLRKIIVTPEMDATNISPLQRLENAVLRKTVELDIVEGIVWGRNGKGARGELTEEGEEAVVKKVLAAGVEY